MAAINFLSDNYAATARWMMGPTHWVEIMYEVAILFLIHLCVPLWYKGSVWNSRPDWTRLGTIHLRRRHVLGGEGSKIGQICQRIVVKNCQREGGRGQKSWKFADVLNGWTTSSQHHVALGNDPMVSANQPRIVGKNFSIRILAHLFLIIS